MHFSHSISINERNDGIVSSAHLSSGSIVSADETGQRAGSLINGCAVCLTLTRAAHVYLLLGPRASIQRTAASIRISSEPACRHLAAQRSCEFEEI